MKNQLNFFSLIFILLMGSNFCFGQNPYTHMEGDSIDSIQKGTGSITKITSTKSGLDTTNLVVIPKHSARKAALLSTAVPGLGQAYNKKYWKIPLVYAGFGAMTYFFTSNNSKFKQYKKALIIRNDGDSTTIDAYIKQYPNQQSLIEYQDYYRRNRDLSVIGFALFYILNIVDASVDANLYYFDVSDDLSLQWSPVLIPASTFASGICLKIKF